MADTWTQREQKLQQINSLKNGASILCTENAFKHKKEKTKTNWNLARPNESEDLSRIPVKYI